MEETNGTKELVTTRSVGMRYGVMLAVVGIAWFVIMNLAGMDLQGPMGYVSYLISAILIFLAHKYYKEEGDGFMTIGQGVGIGFWTGITSGVISSIFTFIYVSYIDASFIEKIKQMQMDKMQEQGMSDAQIDQAMSIAGMFMSPVAITIMGFIGGIFAGVIIGLILSFFTQKKNPDPFVN
jgi:hypothetical protein